MPSNALRTAMLLTLSAGCAACASTRPAQPLHLTQDDFGEATRGTLAAQIINPAPAYERTAIVDSDHAVKATERYQADKVKQPVQLKTSKLASAPDSTN